MKTWMRPLKLQRELLEASSTKEELDEMMEEADTDADGLCSVRSLLE